VFRITDLQSGLAVDISIREIAVEAFREQMNRGGKKPKNRVEFLKRLQSQVEDAIEASLDRSLQPPRRSEEMEGAVRAMMQNVPIPREAFHRRSIMLKWLRDNPRTFGDSLSASDEEQSRSDGQT